MKNPFAGSEPNVPPEDTENAPGSAAAEKQDARKRRVWPIHPVLFALFPLLALYAQNLGQASPVQLVRPLALALLGTLAVWGLFLLLTRHLRKAALAASAVVLVFFSYGHILNLTPLSLRGAVAPVCLLSLALLLFAVFRTRRPLLDATSVLNLAAVVLLLPSCYTIGTVLWETRAKPSSAVRTVNTVVSGQSAREVVHSNRHILPVKNKDLPDVYYIILDAYGRADSLKQFYGYDNTPFLTALEQRGFYIAKHSRANYNQTPICLASALNMTDLDGMASRLRRPDGSLEPCRQMLDDNEVATQLSKQGYHYVYIGSGIGEARVDTADLILNNEPKISGFEGQVMGLTGMDLAAFERSRYDEHRSHLLEAFDNLKKIPPLPYPKFVFTHILAPHPPFVLGPNGESVYPSGTLNLSDGSWLLGQITREQYIQGYTAQLQYVNRRALEAVDAILKQSRKPPIIIIQGDHGSRMNLNWDSLEKTDIREPFSILNAYYVPSRVRKHLYDTITPVNSFRIILTDVFGLNYPTVPDRSFYSTALLPVDFTEVTHLLPRSVSAVSSVKPLPPAPQHERTIRPLSVR